jgi:uncharacterized damage-inducible protein DinB
MTDRSFQRANDESRERLAHLVAALTPTQFEADLGEGWTVASALAHMGFWDRWQAERWTEMLAGRWSASNDSVLAAEHLANEALHPYWAGIGAEDISALAIEAARRVDALIAAAPDAAVDALEGTSVAFLLHRHRHRGEHMDHIERVLAATAAGAAAHAAPNSASAEVAEPIGREFVERNAASRRRLATLVERLRESDLAVPTEDGGWTVGQVLGHMAFWDRFLEARWRAAIAAGAATQPDVLPHELADLLNAALPPSWGSLASQSAGLVAETLAAAEAIDALIAGLPAEAPVLDVLADRPTLLDRSIHRKEHLEQIERALG